MTKFGVLHESFQPKAILKFFIFNNRGHDLRRNSGLFFKDMPNTIIIEAKSGRCLCKNRRMVHLSSP